tara:strand:- start:1099 stop:1425 length:327 start_codon:yes stop_codon:yes gene_type:complete
METAPADITIDQVNDLKISLETHIFTCARYSHDSDNGFTGNLYLLLEAIEHSDKVQCEGIKLIAKGLLKSVIHHKIQKHDMEEVNKKLMEHRESQKEENIIKEDVYSN